MSNLSIIILAAGKGTRMKSDTHKVLNKITGREMINLVVDHVKNLKAKNLCVVVSEDMQNAQEIVLENYSKAQFAIQTEHNGTGDAVKVALSHLKKTAKNTILVLYGDVPLIEQSTLETLCSKVQKGKNSIAVLGFNTKDITNKYGRLITCGHKIERIVEYKDATYEERAVTLCNSGIMAINGKILPEILEKINNKNASNEYYLTDIIQIARQQDLECTFIECPEDEAHGVNSKIDLSEAELIMQNRLRKKHMENGVTLIDPTSVHFHYDTQIGKNVTLHPNIVFGEGVIIKNNVTIKPFTHLKGVTIDDEVQVGPFARIRPCTNIGKKSKIGNFVEIKKSDIREGVKIGHLTYIGDSEIGDETNIGAGTITCNYDGKKKHKTTIGKNAFIGSNTAIVAPVIIGEGAFIGAGSTITKNVAENELAIARNRQTNLRRKKKRKK